MWSEFVEFFGTSNPNMFDTDDEYDVLDQSRIQDENQ